MNRRFFLGLMGAAASGVAAPRSAMGIATTSYMTGWRPRDTLEFLEHCHSLGAGGIQAPLSSTDEAYLTTLRRRMEETGMYLEVMIGLPRTNVEAFETTLRGAKTAGALVVRAACLSGRRYETFDSLAAWKQFVAESKAAIERGLRIAERERLPLALENHKDWTTDEFVDLLKQYSSEYLGVCLDTGNNISLLDDPYDLAERLSPYAISTHIKDMALAEYSEGFLLSEVPLGEGTLDLPRIVSLIRKARPKTRLTLEMITRNPLRVPCLTPKYWATMDRSGKDLARMLQLAKSAKGPLPTINGLDARTVRRLEDDNVKKCLHYSRLYLES